MADILKMITAKRYIENEERVCYYLGTYQTDGWIYFNDDIFWRHNPEFNITQLLYLSKEVWCNTDNLEITSLENLDGTQVQAMTNGAGSVAPNANIETAVKWAINKANNEWITYSQTYRNLKDPTGTSYDCSSFMITAMFVGGYNANASWTGDMVAGFEALGFKYIQKNYIPASDCIRGDILIKEQNPYGHTQMYIGNNQDVNCGDTPARVITHSSDNFGRGYGWDGLLRYEG